MTRLRLLLLAINIASLCLIAFIVWATLRSSDSVKLLPVSNACQPCDANSPANIRI